MLLIGLVNSQDESWLQTNLPDRSGLRLFLHVKAFTYAFYSLIRTDGRQPVLLCSDSLFSELLGSLPTHGLRRDVLLGRVIVLHSSQADPALEREIESSRMVHGRLESPFDLKQLESLLAGLDDELPVKAVAEPSNASTGTPEASGQVELHRILKDIRRHQDKSGDNQEMFRCLARHARALCHAETGMMLSPALGSLFLSESGQKDSLLCLAKGLIENSTLPFNHIIANRSTFLQEPYRLAQLSDFVPGAPQMQSFAAVPLIENGRAVAVLAVANSVSGAFGKAGINNLNLLADIGAMALGNIQSRQQLDNAKLDLSQAYEDLNLTYQDLQNHVVIVDQLQSLGRRIHAAIDIRVILRELVEGAHHLLGCEFCLIAFRENPEQHYNFYTNNEICQFFLEMDGSCPINNLPFFKDPTALGDSYLDNSPPEELVRPMRPYHVEMSNILAVPLTQDNQVLGFLAGFNKREGGFSSTDRFLIRALAGTAITAIMNSSLVRSIKGLFQHSVKSLANAIEARDIYTAGHTDRVSAYVQELAHQLGWDSQALEQAYIGTLLHDIGKIGIPDSILSKPDRLTDEEFDKMRQHVLIGVRIIKDIPQLEPASDFIRHHHERYDGRGYPDKLTGEDIPLAGRLVAVADSFDAMTSDRPYRKGMNLEQAIQELKRNSGTQFDPRVVELFLYLLESGALDKHFRSAKSDSEPILQPESNLLLINKVTHKLGSKAE
ncbi:HD domain-containing protein [bacterium]|nr:HD domain-containing protein [bacterium]